LFKLVGYITQRPGQNVLLGQRPEQWQNVGLLPHIQGPIDTHATP
jgi:hypothetical protein